MHWTGLYDFSAGDRLMRTTQGCYESKCGEVSTPTTPRAAYQVGSAPNTWDRRLWRSVARWTRPGEKGWTRARNGTGAEARNGVVNGNGGAMHGGRGPGRDGCGSEERGGKRERWSDARDGWGSPPRVKFGPRSPSDGCHGAGGVPGVRVPRRGKAEATGHRQQAVHQGGQCRSGVPAEHRSKQPSHEAVVALTRARQDGEQGVEPAT